MTSVEAPTQQTRECSETIFINPSEITKSAQETGVIPSDTVDNVSGGDNSMSIGEWYLNTLLFLPFCKNLLVLLYIGRCCVRLWVVWAAINVVIFIILLLCILQANGLGSVAVKTSMRWLQRALKKYQNLPKLWLHSLNHYRLGVGCTCK